MRSMLSRARSACTNRSIRTADDPLYVMDQLSDKKNSEEHWVEDLSLGEAMQRLPDRERRIIDMRF